MGFFDPWNDNASMISGRSSRRRRSSRSRPKKRRSRSRSRSSSRNRGRSFAESLFGGDRDRYSKHNSSRASFFGLGNTSRSSFFGNNRSSYFKRSPRHGFLQKAYKQVKRLLRDLVHWAKRHPWKVFFLVIMPLVTGGALTALLARFGLRIPPSIERMLGVASRAATGDSFGLVGEAVKIASDFGGNTSVHVQRDSTSYSDIPSPGGNVPWGDLAGMAKKWM